MSTSVDTELGPRRCKAQHRASAVDVCIFVRACQPRLTSGCPAGHSLNLAGNAVTFIEAGEVKVEVRRLPGPPRELTNFHDFAGEADSGCVKSFV